MDTIDEQAANWFSRRSSGQLSANELAELDIWLAASPAHARAFADMQLIWADFDSLSRPATPPAAIVPLQPRRRWQPGKALAASVVLACAALATSQSWFAAKPDVDRYVQSTSGEHRQVELEDGSRIDLNVDTRLHVRLYADRREVELLHGEAFFTVAPDAQRPFDVLTGQGSVRVVGTRFDVRRGDQRLAVVVESGRVALHAQTGTGQPTLLSAGDSADFDYRTGTLQLGQQNPEEIAGWRRGQLIFRDRPLAQLVDELSHYRQAPVQLADPSLATQRVSGSLNIARPDAFLAALPQLLPVQVEYQRDGRALIHAR